MASNDTNSYDNIIELLKQGKTDPLSEQFRDSLLKDIEVLIGTIKDSNKLNISELGKLQKMLSASTELKYQVGITPQVTKELRVLFEGLANKIRDKKEVSLEDVANKFSNVISSSIEQSLRAENRGKPKEARLKNVSENDNLKEIIKEIKKNDIIQDSRFGKLKDFFRESFKEVKKDFKNLGKDIVEGLAASKFVGGALKDTFTLLGLMGASWLSHFGKLGRVAGAAFYVAMTTAGPLLVNLILKGMGGLLGNLGKFIGSKLLDLGKLLAPKFLNVVKHPIASAKTLGGVAANLAVKGGGSLGELITAGTTAQKAVALGKVAGGLGVAAAGATGAVLAGREAGKDWKSGHKGRAVGFGIGAGLMGAGGIAAIVGLFSAAVAPFALPLVAIGAGIAGLVALWKHHSEFIKSAFKKVGSFLGKALEFFLMFNPIFQAIKWIRDNWPFGKDKENNNNGGNGFVNNLVQGVKSKFLGAIGKDQDEKKVSTVGALELNKAGGMINIGKMNKMQASNAVVEYMNARPEQFKNAYELAGSKYVSLGSMTNDLAIRNKQGVATQAVLYAGASKNLENAWAALEAAGMSKERAELMKYTSGRATADSTHKKYGARSHSNIMNMVTDLGVGNQWTDAEWRKAIEVLRPIYAAQGFDLQFEGKDKNGKTIIGSEYVPGLSNKHFHVGLSKGKEGLMPESALKYQEQQEQQQKVTAERHQLQAMQLVKSLEGEERMREIRKNLDKTRDNSPEALEAEYKKELLNKYGVFAQKGKDGQEHWMYTDKSTMQIKEFDPTGNLDFLKKTMTNVTNYNQ